MKFLHHLFFLSLLFIIPSQSSAETLIQSDIVQDTTWTKEMSPVFLEPQSNYNGEDNYDIHVINGAVLTIEAGVKVIMAPRTSLRVIKDCQRSYKGRVCIKDSNGEIKYSRLIAIGTKNSPIVFTSENDFKKRKGKAGDWGVVSLESFKNEIEYTEFRYGGGVRGYKYFVSIGKNSIFKNNIVEKSLLNGVFFKDINFEGNRVNDHSGIGVECKTACNVKGNVIKNNGKEGLVINTDSRVYDAHVKGNMILDNGGNGITAKVLKESVFDGNFISNNKGSALLLERPISIPIYIKNNYFSHNAGALNLYSAYKEVFIENNNFLENSEYAITLQVNSEDDLKTSGNWFGIDTGASTESGEFFVSPAINTSNFKEDANDFNLDKNTIAGKEYENFLKTRKIDTRLFSFEVDQAVFLGKGSNAGSLLQYKVVAKNEKTKTLKNVKIQITVPKNQVFLECSIQIESSNSYSAENSCKNIVSETISHKKSSVIWNESYKALEVKNLYFLVLQQDSQSSLAQVDLPKIQFTHNATNSSVNYSLEHLAEVHENGKSSISSKSSSVSKKKTVLKKTSTNTAKEKTTKKVTKKTKSVNTKILAKRFFHTENLSNNAQWNSYKLEDRKEAYAIMQEWQKAKEVKKVSGALAQGKVVQRVLNDQLYFYLQTESGEEYKLLSSAQWQELLTVSRNKTNNTAVFGKFYINNKGQKTGIIFTKLEAVE